MPLNFYLHPKQFTKFNKSKVNRSKHNKDRHIKLYLSIAIFYKFDIAAAIPCREINKHEKNQKAFHKNIWLPNECLR